MFSINCLICIFFTLLLILAMPLAISIFIYLPEYTGCQFNLFGFQTDETLLSVNSVSIILILTMTVFLILLCLRKIPIIGMIFSIIFNILLAIFWITIALIILSNDIDVSCRVQGIIYLGYAIVIIIMTLITCMAMKTN